MLFTKYLDRMGFGVWLVGYADQPHPKISFFRRLRRESGRAFHKVSDFVKILYPVPPSLIPCSHVRL
jgi:hypothetical protein